LKGPGITCWSSKNSGCLLSTPSRRSHEPAPSATSLAKLQQQHESILQQLQFFLRSAENVSETGGEKDQKFNALTIRQFTRLKKLLDKHHTEEERVLTPIVAKYLDSKAGESIRRDHSELWKSLQQLNRILQGDDHDGSQHRFFHITREFKNKVREQFSREENVIYWFVSLSLPQLEQLTGCGSSVVDSGRNCMVDSR